MMLIIKLFLIYSFIFFVQISQGDETQPPSDGGEVKASSTKVTEGIKGIFADCVREICGTTDFQKIYRDANFEEKAQSRIAEKEVIDTYKKFLDTKNTWLMSLKGYSEKVPLSSTATRFAVITEAVDGAVTYKHGGSFVDIDLSGKTISFKPRDDWKNEKPEIKKFKGEIANVLVSSKHMLANTYLLYGFTAPMAYRALNSEDSFQAAVRKDLQQALKKIEILSQNFSENELKAIGIFRKGDLERFAKMKYFDETTGGVILKATSKISIFSEMLQSKAIRKAADNLPQQDLSKIVHLQRNIDDIKQMKSIQEKDLNLGYMDNRVVETCASSFEQSITNLPTKAQVEIAKIKFENLRTHFLSNLSKIFSHSTSEKLKTFLSRDKMPFFLSQSQEEFKSSFYDGLRSLKESQNVDPNAIAQYKDNSSLYFSMLLWNAAPVLELKTFCDSLKFNTIRDHTSELGGVVVGAESIKDIEFGESVLIHELGHQVHHFLGDYPISGESKIKFEKMVQCLNGMHGQELASHTERLKIATEENERERKVLLNEKRYLGEDFSDLLSARFSKGNLGCKLVLASQYSPKDLKNINETDVHSSGIFRLLHVYKVKGWSSNSSCNQAMEKVKTKEKFEDCFDVQ